MIKIKKLFTLTLLLLLLFLFLYPCYSLPIEQDSSLRVPFTADFERQATAQKILLFLKEKGNFQNSPEKLVEFLEERKIITDKICLDLLEPYIEKILGIKEGEKEAYLNSIIYSSVPSVVLASRDKIARLFDDDFVPGTFMVGERVYGPPFLAEGDNM
jgi:hypothetical protein